MLYFSPRIKGRYEMKGIKKYIFDLLDPTEQESKLERYIDIFIISLIILNVVMVIADTFQLPQYIKDIFNVLEAFSVIVFTIEYLLRLWTSSYLYPGLSAPKACIKYIFFFYGCD